MKCETFSSSFSLTILAHITTGGTRASGRPWQFLRSIKWASNGNTYNGVLMHDEFDVDKLIPTITATVSNKALTSNVATLTTSAAHGFAVGMEIVVSGVDATFNGEYTITTVPTSTTFTYAKTASNVTSTAATGTVTSNVTHFIDYISGTDDPVFALLWAQWFLLLLALDFLRYSFGLPLSASRSLRLAIDFFTLSLCFSGFAGGYEVVGGVGSASVMFDQVVCFGGWCATPVACV